MYNIAPIARARNAVPPAAAAAMVGVGRDWGEDEAGWELECEGMCWTAVGLDSSTCVCAELFSGLGFGL
jgi:hypothetical protein